MVNDQYHFKVLYERLHDGSYQAWVPALPACQASGSSIGQARSRVEEAIRCYCLNMLEHGAAVPASPPGQPAVVDEIQVNLGIA
jgi:predicted RNase H-like HicB family nuclease